MYQPDNFVALKIEKDDTLIFRILAGWSGGYLDGDSWKLNSGITKIEEDGDFYLVHGYSGSIYKLHKNSETVRMNMAGTLNSLLDKFPDIVTVVPLKDIVL